MPVGTESIVGIQRKLGALLRLNDSKRDTGKLNAASKQEEIGGEHMELAENFLCQCPSIISLRHKHLRSYIILILTQFTLYTIESVIGFFNIFEKACAVSAS